MKIKKVVRGLTAFSEKLQNDNITSFAAESAFFVVTSFVPFLILIFSLLKRLPFDFATIRLEVELLSPGVADFIKGLLNEASSKAPSTLIGVATVSAVWAASRCLLAIIRGLNQIYGMTEKRGYWQLRLTAILYVVVLLLMIITVLVILVGGEWINGKLMDLIRGFSGVSEFIMSLRWVIGWLALILFFMFIYTVVPERKTRFITELPGAVLSALGWLIFSWLFSVYIENFSNYSSVYGSLTAVIILMLWLYFCMYILFAGAEFNDFIQERAFFNKKIEKVFENKHKKRKDTESTYVQTDNFHN